MKKYIISYSCKTNWITVQGIYQWINKNIDEAISEMNVTFRIELKKQNPEIWDRLSEKSSLIVDNIYTEDIWFAHNVSVKWILLTISALICLWISVASQDMLTWILFCIYWAIYTYLAFKV